MEVVSLYDFTGEALRPWAEAGYQCHAYDIQHPHEGRVFARASILRKQICTIQRRLAHHIATTRCTRAA